MRNILIFTIFTLFSCSGTNSMLLENDPIIRKNFSKNEIKELRKILNFFDNVVVQNCQTQNDLMKCYDEYLFELKNNTIFCGSIDLKIDSVKQQKLIDGIDTSLFNKIWFYSGSFNPSTGETFVSLSLRLKSDYMDYIKDLAKTDTVYNSYYDAIQMSGTLSPSLVAGILQNYHLINVKNDRERIVLALHYLSLNFRKLKEKSTVHNTV